MVEYVSEEQRVEALRRWWQENGRYVLLSIAAVFIGVFGWQTWQDRQETQAEAASAAYESMRGIVGQDAAAAVELGRAIVNEFPGSPYAALASLTLASIAVEQGELESAAAHLAWAQGQGKLDGVAEVAALRLARVQLALGDGDAALATLDHVTSDAFAAPAAEVRGDILFARGELAQARDAYLAALVGYAEAPGKQAAVEMKLNEIAVGGEPEA